MLHSRCAQSLRRLGTASLQPGLGNREMNGALVVEADAIPIQQDFEHRDQPMKGIVGHLDRCTIPGQDLRQLIDHVHQSAADDPAMTRQTFRCSRHG